MRASEAQIIREYLAPLAGEGAFNFTDDACILRPQPGQDLVMTQDALIESIHFLKDDPPETIARKLIRVNISDLVAKGAQPLGCLLTLALPATWQMGWLEGFIKGLRQDIETFGCPLMGGDTTATTGPVTLSLTAIGTVPCGTMVRRGTARPGDILYVSGTIGDAALALKMPLRGVKETHQNHLRQRYLLPMPRVSLTELVRELASAAMDISDGLVGDLEKLCESSGVSARIIQQDVPLSEAACACVDIDQRLVMTALTGGDDYEILACVPEERSEEFARRANALGEQVTRIGQIEQPATPPLVYVDGPFSSEFAQIPSSYTHF